ncbi:ethanolamine ammonia-lyase subunit EutC [uncultured Cohaesibacter sp.]|uniref:ethanolamine ammonia-lyase subunit EutC n=1 Tax=uncultured Cohaesibacter sp. TaxID=1002546 RepID=UPI0029C77361|nr:ethanolamine ammonia-lyase subunit EutC [uncultured Cohaesibacter sp.]
MSDLIELDPFRRFREVTRARIGIGRTGDGIPTKAVLDFQLAHARARDAVHGQVDFVAMADRLAPLPTLNLRSKASDRLTYLSRPDLGRELDESSLEDAPEGPFDVAFVIADGLSASAVEAHAEAVLKESLALLKGLTIAPVVLAEQARVAFGDEAAAALGARLVVVLIGERPGLTTPSSLGAYLTYSPRKGRLDSERNCISNIHDDGLSHQAAAHKIDWIVREAIRLQLTGVDLKENSSDASLLIDGADE